MTAVCDKEPNCIFDVAVNKGRLIQTLQSNILNCIHFNVVVVNEAISNKVEDGVIVLRHIPSIH